MPSINDVFTELQQVNTRLQQLHNDLAVLTNSTNANNGTTSAGFVNVSQGFPSADCLGLLHEHGASAQRTAKRHNDLQSRTDSRTGLSAT